MLVTLRNASPTWPGDKTGKPKIDFSHEPSSGSLSSEVLCRPTVYSCVPTRETGLTQTKLRAFQRCLCNILSTPQCAATAKSIITVLELKCPTLSLCIAVHNLVQKRDFWDGDAINFSKIRVSASIRLMYSVRLFKNNMQAYNLLPAK